MAYYTQQCDSYFVESHGNQEKIIRDGIRQREKQRKQQTQAAIAEELSLLTSDEYREDVLQHMETMEVSCLCAYPLSPTDLSSSWRHYPT